jgi:hypothetical protein
MKLTKEQLDFLEYVVDGTWALNSEGKIDVNGNVKVTWGGFYRDELPVEFGIITGYFWWEQTPILTKVNFIPEEIEFQYVN